MKKIDKNSNFLDLTPDKKCRWEKCEDEKIQLLVPRFKNRWMQKFVVKMGKSEYFKVSLDNLGSRVWESIDGTRTVGQIGEILEKETEPANGEAMPQVYERLTQFISTLFHHRLIDFKYKKGDTYG